MRYEVTLIEGYDDLSFEFDDYGKATSFIAVALKTHKGKETEEGFRRLIVEIEAVPDNF